jgi:hypothetical protein
MPDDTKGLPPAAVSAWNDLTQAGAALADRQDDAARAKAAMVAATSASGSADVALANAQAHYNSTLDNLISQVSQTRQPGPQPPPEPPPAPPPATPTSSATVAPPPPAPQP